MCADTPDSLGEPWESVTQGSGMESALHDAGSQERGLRLSHVVPSFMGGGEACRTGAGGAGMGQAGIVAFWT